MKIFKKFKNEGRLTQTAAKEDFFDKAQFWKKGTIDPSNGYQVKADCYNIKIDELHTLKELMEECMKNS